MARLLFLQVILMAVLSVIGYMLSKFKIIGKKESKIIGNILIYITLPLVIFKSFLLERTLDRIIGLGISALGAIVTLILGILISKLLNRKDPIANFASCFSNPGFFGVPLVIASISSGAVFYIASYVAILNVLQWTYGVYLITQNKKDISIKKVVTAPSMIAFTLGLIFFFLNIRFPSGVMSILDISSQINTTLAMFTVGIYLSQTSILKMLKRLSNYKVSFIRLALIPMVGFLVLSLIPTQFMEVRLVLLIALLCPVGSNIAVLAELNNGDYPYAVETVVMSAIFSIISIPLLFLLATILWGI